jgi:hypothetical protein
MRYSILRSKLRGSRDRAVALWGEQQSQQEYASRVRSSGCDLRSGLEISALNNVDRLAESKNEVLARVKERAASYDAPRLQRAARDYGNVRTKKFFSEALSADVASHAR